MECCCYVIIITPLVFECFVKKKKIILTKCKQKICSTKMERKKMKTTFFCQKEKNFVLTNCKKKCVTQRRREKKMKTTPYVLSIKQ